MRHANALTVDSATAAFLEKHLLRRGVDQVTGAR
jgi:hypothetical protein